MAQVDADKAMTGRLPNRAREGNQICYELPQTTGFLSKALTKTQSRADLGYNQSLSPSFYKRGGSPVAVLSDLPEVSRSVEKLGLEPNPDQIGY